MAPWIPAVAGASADPDDRVFAHELDPVATVAALESIGSEETP